MTLSRGVIVGIDGVHRPNSMPEERYVVVRYASGCVQTSGWVNELLAFPDVQLLSVQLQKEY